MQEWIISYRKQNLLIYQNEVNISMSDYIQSLLIEQRRKKMEEANNVQAVPPPKRNLPEYILKMQQSETSSIDQSFPEPSLSTENQSYNLEPFISAPPQAVPQHTENTSFEDLKSFISLFFLQENIEDALTRVFLAVAGSVDIDILELMFVDIEQEVVFLFAVDANGPVMGEEFLAYDDTPLGGFLNSAQPVIVSDLQTKTDYIFTSMVSENNLKSLMQVPCATSSGFLGFLNFYSSKADAFTFENQEYCQIFANMMAIYLENGTLREKLNMSKASAPAPKRADIQLAKYLERELQYPLEELKSNVIKMGDKKLGRLAPKQSEYLDTILHTLNSSKKRVEQLQEYLYVVSGKIMPELKRIELYKICSDVQSAISPLLETKSVRMLMEIDRKFPPVIADYKILKRVLYAICENAIDKTRIGGVFRMSVYEDKRTRTAELVICDFGVEPIAKDDYNNLFTPFAFFEHTLSSNRGKMFLNMPLAKIYTDMMGGKISVESSKEDGTTFSVFLPLS